MEQIIEEYGISILLLMIGGSVIAMLHVVVGYL